MAKVYQKKNAKNPSGITTCVRVNSFGTIIDQWSMIRMGNGGLENEDRSLIGRHISDLDGFHIVPEFWNDH